MFHILYASLITRLPAGPDLFILAYKMTRLAAQGSFSVNRKHITDTQGQKSEY